MSSSSITVKPRRRPDQNKTSSTSAASQNSGTVLIRNPLPKYSFQQKQAIPKDNKSNKSEKRNKNSLETSKCDTDSAKASADESKGEKINTVINDGKNGGDKSESTDVTSSNSVGTSLQGIANLPFNKNDIYAVPKAENGEKPVNKVGPISKSSSNVLTHSISDSVISIQDRPLGAALSQLANPAEQHEPPASSNSICEDCQTASPTENHFVRDTADTGVCKCSEKVKHLEEEKQMLKNQLEVQLQV